VTQKVRLRVKLPILIEKAQPIAARVELIVTSGYICIPPEPCGFRRVLVSSVSAEGVGVRVEGNVESVPND
jgi:hypothetical protein